ncbi:hypothetical protein FHW89_002387 [Mucilaginibacter sp. SG564]|nr:hypothetical protein [Mucilaginibacter sp. SG564]
MKACIYHCCGDEEVSFDHFISYRHKLSDVIFNKMKSGGVHQPDNDLNLVVKDIKNL